MTDQQQDTPGVDDRLADDPNAAAVPSSDYPRRDTKTPDPRHVPELRWRGTQQWICSFVAAWDAADGWYVIEWGDGTSDVCHPDLRIARHSYTRNSSCANIANTAVARPLYRDWTTGPAVARSVLQARGWGAPQHDFRVFETDPNRVFARLFRTETPLGYGIAWDPDTAITQLPDGESNTEHLYPTGPTRQPLIGVLDRPARRLRWFPAPVINNKRIHPSSVLTAWFGNVTEWDGGYSGDLHVANHTSDPLSWVVEFVLDAPGVLREVWPSPGTRMEQLSDRRWRVWSATPIPAAAETRAGMRIEPAGDPTKWPQQITAEPPRPVNKDEDSTEDPR